MQNIASLTGPVPMCVRTPAARLTWRLAILRRAPDVIVGAVDAAHSFPLLAVPVCWKHSCGNKRLAGPLLSQQNSAGDSYANLERVACEALRPYSLDNFGVGKCQTGLHVACPLESAHLNTSLFAQLLVQQVKLGCRKWWQRFSSSVSQVVILASPVWCLVPDPRGFPPPLTPYLKRQIVLTQVSRSIGHFD